MNYSTMRNIHQRYVEFKGKPVDYIQRDGINILVIELDTGSNYYTATSNIEVFIDGDWVFLGLI